MGVAIIETRIATTERDQPMCSDPRDKTWQQCAPRMRLAIFRFGVRLHSWREPIVLEEFRHDATGE
jgi:hypothetical protein